MSITVSGSFQECAACQLFSLHRERLFARIATPFSFSAKQVLCVVQNYTSQAPLPTCSWVDSANGRHSRRLEGGGMKKAEYYLLSCITPGAVSAGERGNGCYCPVIPALERQSLPSLSHFRMDRPHHVSKSSLMALASELSSFCSFSTKTNSSFLLLLIPRIPHFPRVWLLSSSIIASLIPCAKFLYLKDLGWVLLSWQGVFWGKYYIRMLTLIPRVSKLYWAPTCANQFHEVGTLWPWYDRRWKVKLTFKVEVLSFSGKSCSLGVASWFWKRRDQSQPPNPGFHDTFFHISGGSVVACTLPKPPCCRSIISYPSPWTPVYGCRHSLTTSYAAVGIGLASDPLSSSPVTNKA